MTPEEGKVLFDQVFVLLLQCYLYGLGIGLGLRVFWKATEF